MSDKMPESKPRSRRFFWWFIIIQLAPLVGIPVMPSIPTVWILIVLVNTCVFCFNLAVYHGRGTDEDATANRLMFLIISALFGLMALTWAVRLAMTIYRTGSLGFATVASGVLTSVSF